MPVLGLLVLIFSALAVVGLIVVIIRRSKVARWIMGGIAVVLLLLVASLFLSRASHVIVLKQGDTTGHVYTPPYLSHPPAAPVQPSVTPAVWSSGLQDQFHADNYPSMAAAAKALGRQVAEGLRSVMPEFEMPALVRIYGTGPHQPDMATFQFVAAELRKLDGIAQVDIGNGRSPHETIDQPVRSEIVVQLSLWELLAAEGFSSGTLCAEALASNGQFVRTVQFVTKPWVENFSAHVNQNPQGRWLLARSQTSCTSPGEAHREALEDARSQLHTDHFPGFRRNSITSFDVENGGFITDRFTQSFEGSVGLFWREALLINAAPGKIVQVTQMHGAASRAIRGRTARHIVSLVSLLVLICVVYAFLNAATKGYYTWALRIGAVVVIIVGILVALAVIA